MFKAKKKALSDLMGLLDEEKANKIKVVVAGDSPEEVKKGLEVAKEKMDDLPEMAKASKDDPISEMLKKMSPEKRKAMMKKMES